jgi:hypothetical protein
MMWKLPRLSTTLVIVTKCHFVLDTDEVLLLFSSLILFSPLLSSPPLLSFLLPSPSLFSSPLPFPLPSLLPSLLFSSLLF